jgi:hypothetical protein
MPKYLYSLKRNSLENVTLTYFKLLSGKLSCLSKTKEKQILAVTPPSLLRFERGYCVIQKRCLVLFNSTFYRAL